MFIKNMFAVWFCVVLIVFPGIVSLNLKKIKREAFRRSQGISEYLEASLEPWAEVVSP